MKHDTDAIATVWEWAKVRAAKSGQPSCFMNHFEDELNAVLGGADLLDLYWDTSDSIHVAAEIEALGAIRILKQWDRRYELTIGRPKRYRR